MFGLLRITVYPVHIALIGAVLLYVCTAVLGHSDCEVVPSHIVYSHVDVRAFEPQELVTDPATGEPQNQAVALGFALVDFLCEVDQDFAYLGFVVREGKGGGGGMDSGKLHCAIFFQDGCRGGERGACGSDGGESFALLIGSPPRERRVGGLSH